MVEAIDGRASLWGVGRSGEPLLVEPKGVAVGPDGRVYVAEGRAHRVTVFNADGSIATSWGEPGAGEGQFAEPWGIAVSPAGDVFVADTWNHRVQKFGPDGRFLLAWGGLTDTRGDPQASPGRFWGPRDVAIGPDGLLYVSDTGNKRVQVSDQNGVFVRAIGGPGSEPGQFNEPVGLAFHGDTLLVADAWNGRIQRLDVNGVPRGAVPIGGWENRSVANKPYLAVDDRGRIFVTAPAPNQVTVVSPDGRAQPWPRPSDGRGRLGTPTGVEAGPHGQLYVTESSGGALSVYPTAVP